MRTTTPKTLVDLSNVRHLLDACADDVVTYGLSSHLDDPERRITKVNFFGAELRQQSPQSAGDLNELLRSLYMGKQIIDGRLDAEGAGYISGFRATDMTAPSSFTDYRQ